MRTASVERSTGETSVRVTASLDGTGKRSIATGIGFLDHMLEQLAKHSLIDLDVAADGDLHIDGHHTTEDTGYAVGRAVADALGDRRGIRRFGHALIPMDETLSRVVVDLSGRPYLVWKVAFTQNRLGEMDTELFREWFQAFTPGRRLQSARRESVWRQQSPRDRILLQGTGAQPARRRPGRPGGSRRDSVDQGRPAERCPSRSRMSLGPRRRWYQP